MALVWAWHRVPTTLGLAVRLMDTGGWKGSYRLWGYAQRLSVVSALGTVCIVLGLTTVAMNGWRDEVMGAVPYSTDMNLET